MAEQVNHPEHYGGEGSPFEVIKIIEAYNIGFCDGNVLKYLLRWRNKDGMQDLYKCRWYLDRFIKEQEEIQAHDSNSSR